MSQQRGFTGNMKYENENEASLDIKNNIVAQCYNLALINTWELIILTTYTMTFSRKHAVSK